MAGIFLEVVRREEPEAEACAYRRIRTAKQAHFDTRNNRLRADVSEGLAFATLFLVLTYVSEANLQITLYRCEINFLRKHGLELVNNRFASKSDFFPRGTS